MLSRLRVALTNKNLCDCNRPKKVVTLASDYAYGYEVVGGFQKSFEANGGLYLSKRLAVLDMESG